MVGSRIQTQAIRFQSLSSNQYHGGKPSALVIFALWIFPLNVLDDGGGALHRVGGTCLWLPWGHWPHSCLLVANCRKPLSTSLNRKVRVFLSCDGCTNSHTLSGLKQHRSRGQTSKINFTGPKMSAELVSSGGFEGRNCFFAFFNSWQLPVFLGLWPLSLPSVHLTPVLFSVIK